MPLKPHPTDPDKMVYVKREYNLPKEWVGLTDEERKEIMFKQKDFWGNGWELKCMEAIEAKLKEKNL